MSDEEEYTAEETAAMRVYRTWHPLVVHVAVKDHSGRTMTEGSGVLWDDAGHLLTNAHVVSGGAHFVCTFVSADADVGDKEVCAVSASLLAADMLRDVAVLLLDEPYDTNGVTALHCGGTKARVGQRVHVLGAPFGLAHSLTAGVVSGVGRELTVRPGLPPLYDLVQTDAAVNRGCSGGPVVSAGGRLVGVATAIATPTGTFAGVGFCVPHSTVRMCTETIIASGGSRVPPFPALGVVLAPDLTVRGSGLAVVSVRRGGPAEQGGIRGAVRGTDGAMAMGDVLLSVAGVHVKDVVDVWRALRRNQVGDEVRVVVKRAGVGKLDVRVQLMDVQDLGADRALVRRLRAKM